MSKRLILLEHAVQRIKHGDERGRRTQLKTRQVLEYIGNPRMYVEYRGKVRDGRVFFSPIDQKCLVAWIEDCGSHYKVHTIENHHHLIPIPILFRAEQNVLGDVGFLRRFTKPPAEALYDAVCRIGVHELTVTLSGYLYPGISWWRSVTNVRRILGFIQKHDTDGTDPLVLTGKVWHGRENRQVTWSERLPQSFPEALYRDGNQPGTIPDFAAIAAEALHLNGQKGGNHGQ